MPSNREGPETSIPMDTPLGAEQDGWVDEIDYEDIFGDNKHKTQHDFVREWLPRVNDHLRAILATERLANSGVCAVCADPSGLWVCLDCHSHPAYCRNCCRERHMCNPFHRIKYWADSHYSPDWLFNLGVTVHLGHNGKQCPTFNSELVSEDELDSPIGDKIDIYKSPSRIRDRPQDAELFTVGHVNGIHRIWVTYCSCVDSPSYDIQCLSAGLFPLSFSNCRSAFTFAMLDDFRRTNLICQVSSYFYFKKLRRLTHPWFFHVVPDRYKELRRCNKQWSYLDKLKHAGIWNHNHLETHSPASLALFCAMCPQEGINIPENWSQDPEQLPYTRSFVMDGNFSAVHQKNKEASSEPWLTDGALFLAKRLEFDRYLAVATEEKETATCHSYHAVNDRLIKHKGRDVTGIGSTACARHGAFCPGGTVNFQKGERQVNMDYSLCSSINYTNVGTLPSLIMLYDINCQYHVNFRRRIERNPGITFPFDKKVYWGIGEFHVTAHVPHCFARHSPQFIPGAGWVDGEILETLWSQLRDIFPSTQSATLASRAESLNDHMQESNWKKMMGAVPSVLTKYRRASKELKDATEVFNKVSQNVRKKSPPLLEEWETMAKTANIERSKNPSAMDIYDTKFESKASRVQRQNEEIREELRTGNNPGATAWLVEGMKLQELQHNIRVLLKRTEQSDNTRAEINRKRESLLARLNKFVDQAEVFIPQGPSSAEIVLQGSFGDYLHDDYVDSDEEPIYIPDNTDLKKRKPPRLDSPRKRRKPNPSADPLLPENQDIVLPSTFGKSVCQDLQMSALVAKELNLREGQANDALAAIRLAIGERSFLLRKKIRPVVGKKQKGRSWEAVHACKRKIRTNQWTYTKAVEAMKALGASEEALKDYRELKEDDLRTITTVVVPNAPGQKRKALSWIWTIGVGREDEGEADDHTQDSAQAIVTEMTRLNWLRAREQAARSTEEFGTAAREMVWTVRYFLYQHETWYRVSVQAGVDIQAYAAAQANMWYDLAAYASRAFHFANPSYPTIFGYKQVMHASTVSYSDGSTSEIMTTPARTVDMESEGSQNSSIESE